jgi:transcription elongation factor GreA
VRRFPITVRGEERLRAELKRLKSEDRPTVIKAIAEAEYHAAREHQGFIEGRIKEIESRLANSEVIDVSKLPQTGKVVFGATVELEAQNDGARVKYQIVGEDEADIRQGLIAVTSPIARALVSKQQGDVVEVQAPGGVRSYEIVTVRYQ